jgi:uncharacterized SAM-dependent methyltransferase
MILSRGEGGIKEKDRGVNLFKKVKETGVQDGGSGRESEILSSMIPETSLRCRSYTWVILTASNQNKTTITLDADEIQRPTLKSAFNCT